MHTRIRSTVSLTALSFAVAALASPTLRAQGNLRNALPAHTIVYVSAPDIAGTLAKAESTPLMKMWREAEVQDFFADGLKLVEEKWNEALEQGRAMHDQGALPFSPDELLKLRLDGLSFALTGFDLTEGQWGPEPKIGVVAHLDFGASAGTWRKVIEFGLQAMKAEAGDDLRNEDFKVGDVEVTSLVPPETQMSLNVAFVGNGLVFGTIRSEVEEVLTRMASGDKDLAASPNFANTFAKLGPSGAEMEFFVQPGPVLDFVMRALQMAADTGDLPPMVDIAGVERAVDALGLRGVKAMGSTAGYEGGKSVSRGFFYAPADERKGLLAGKTRDLDMSFLKWVPKDVASFSASTFDIDAVYDALVAALKAYDDEMADQVMGMLAQQEEQLGIKLKEDLFGAFGDEFISWSWPVAAIGAAPEVAMLLKVRDQERLLKSLRTLAKLSQGRIEIDESQRRGITVYTLLINWDPTGGMGFNPLDMFIPTFSFKDGYMVAGFSTGDVKRVFNRMDREDDDPSGDIRSNPEFAPYLDKLPKSMNSVSFSDWKANFEGIYQMLTSFAAFIPVDDRIPIDLSLLPDVSTLTQHLYGAVSWSTAAADGYRTVSISPWGPETAGLVGAAVGAGVVLVLGEAR